MVFNKAQAFYSSGLEAGKMNFEGKTNVNVLKNSVGQWLMVLLAGILLFSQAAFNLMQVNAASYQGILLQWFVFQGCLMAVVYRMGQNHLPRIWLGLLLVFLWLIGTSYFTASQVNWVGLSALLAVYCVWLHLRQVYAGEIRPSLLSTSALFTALTGWLSVETGLLLALAILFFSWIHCFLHEREEKDLRDNKISSQAVLNRWFPAWGVYWLLPFVLCHLVEGGLLTALNLWPQFLTDSGSWLSAFFKGKAPIPGYFSSFHREFEAAFQPLTFSNRIPHWLGFAVQILTGLRLLGIGVLPVLGILGMGYQVPGRFVYRLLQRPDEELLLFWLSGAALILATFLDSSTVRIVSDGTLSFLLGFLVLARWLTPRPKAQREFYWILALFFGLWLAADVLMAYLRLT
ncbi:hypothetical protein [Vampirovibrio sp.]|uniref:hypothetical protein n=1 Tax=Vampirovibrio sp. TaxID=2717857 RepID=UPI003592F5B4